MVLATHGWWPWLLLYAAILILVAWAIVTFVERRRTVR